MTLIGDNPSPSLLGNGPVPKGGGKSPGGGADKTDRSGKPPKNSLLSQAKANKGGGSLTADTHNPGNKGKSQRSKPQTGQSGNELNPSIKGRAESNRRHGQNQQGEKASSSKRALTGTAVGALLFGAGGAATGAAIVGGTAGVVALGSTVTFGLIGAAAGSAVPVVGTIVGASVGLLVGALVGHIYGRASAETANADYLNTDPDAPGNRLQRSQNWALQRATMPENLGKRGLRLAKPARRWWVWRICINLKRLCVSISDDKKALEWEARGRNAVAGEARNDLRYTVAAEMSYTHKDGTEAENRHFEETHSTAAYLAKAREADKKYGKMFDKIQKRPKEISEKELEDMIPLPRPKDPEFLDFLRFSDKPNKWRRQKYAHLYKESLIHHPRNVVRIKALSDNRVRKWDFQMIGPDAKDGSVAKQVYEALPGNVQKSLSDNGGLFRDHLTGTNARLIYDRANNEVIISYNAAGGNKDFDAAQAAGTAGNYANEQLPSIRQAELLGRVVREAVASVNNRQHLNRQITVVCTGHCRGGLMAAKDVQANGGIAITFNPEPEGGGLRDASGLYSSEVVSKEVNILNYSVRNDPMSGSGIWSFVGNCIETGTGIAMPVIYGPRLILPRWPGTTKHKDPVLHMCHLITGGTPPRKARWRRGPEVSHPFYYLPAPHYEVRYDEDQPEKAEKAEKADAVRKKHAATNIRDIIEEEEEPNGGDASGKAEKSKSDPEDAGRNDAIENNPLLTDEEQQQPNGGRRRK